MTRKNGKLVKDDIFQILFDRVANGYYEPGCRLTEQMFADEFSISRTPIREVLNQLASLGLVKISPNKGAEVIGLTCDDVEEMYDIRKVLELLALESALPNIRLQDLSRLRTLIESIKPDTDLNTVAKIDYELHSYIVNQSGKSRLKSILNQLYILLIRNSSFPMEGRTQELCAEHLEIIDTLFLRDEQKAKDVLSKHLEKSKTIALEYMFCRKKL